MTPIAGKVGCTTETLRRWCREEASRRAGPAAQARRWSPSRRRARGTILAMLVAMAIGSGLGPMLLGFTSDLLGVEPLAVKPASFSSASVSLRLLLYTRGA